MSIKEELVNELLHLWPTKEITFLGWMLQEEPIAKRFHQIAMSYGHDVALEIYDEAKTRFNADTVVAQNE